MVASLVMIWLRRLSLAIVAVVISCGGPSPEPDLILKIMSPSDGTFTNGTITITATVDGGEPATISFVVDGQITVATPRGPSPFSSGWDTINASEGSHTVVARATSGGKVFSSDPVTVVVDRTRPTVISLTPASGATEVVLRAPIAVSFSEPLLPSTLGTSQFALDVAGSAVPVTANLSTDGTKVSLAITDTSTLILPARFAISLTSSLTDRAGNTVVWPGDPWAWTVPDWIRHDAIRNGFSPMTIVGQDFRPVVVSAQLDECIEHNGACAIPLRVRKNNGQGWTMLGRLNGLVSRGAIWLDAQGNPVVTGLKLDDVSNVISVGLSKWNGSGWTSLDAFPLGSEFNQLALEFASNGTPAVAWDAKSTGTGNVMLAMWVDGRWSQRWGALRIASANFANNGRVDMAFDERGDPVLAWAVDGLGGIARSNGVSFVSTPSIPMLTPSVAVDQAGEPMMVQSEGGESHVVKYAGNSWQRAIEPAVPMNDMASFSKVSTSPAGEIVVSWYEQEALASPGRVGFSRWTGTRWDARAGVFTAGGVPYVESIHVVVDARGSAWVTWSERTDDGIETYVWMSNY